MADRTLRRAQRKTDGDTDRNGGGIISVEVVTGGTDGSVKNDDRVSDNSSTNPIDEPNESIDADRSGVIEVDPGKLSEFIAGGGTSAYRGETGEPIKQRRKRGPNKRTTQAQTANLEPILILVHTWASVLLKAPVLMISSEESKQLSNAYAEFSKYHNVPALSEKRMSEINLIGALALVYGTRIVTIVRSHKKVKQAAPVVPINRPASGSA